jgi:anti-sigma factor RsiW
VKRLFRRWQRAPAAPGGLTCRELVELVTDYFDGALDAGTRARFEEHLGLCDHCTVHVEQMRATIRLVGSLAPEDMSPEAERELLEAFRGWKAGGGA